MTFAQKSMENFLKIIFLGQKVRKIWVVVTIHGVINASNIHFRGKCSMTMLFSSWKGTTFVFTLF